MMKGHILVVDDEKDLRDLLSKQLQTGGYQTSEAENGQMAQSMIQGGSFDAVLSDIMMPVMDGIELLEWVKKTKPTAFILMTAFSEIMEAQEAYAKGADEFLTKPFRTHDLIAVVDKCLQKPPSAATNVDTQFSEVNIDEVAKSDRMVADVYIRLSAVKYLMVAHKDQKVDLERIESYKKKGVTSLFIKKAA